MKKEDIIDGEIYIFNDSFLNKINFKDPDFNVKCWIDLGANGFSNNKTNNTDYENCIEATSVEKHWLNKCIELNEFISKDEALKDYHVITIVENEDLSYLVPILNDLNLKQCMNI